MTIPGTTVGRARTAIYTAVSADPLVIADPTIHVMYDEPNPGGVMTDDIISVGDVQQSEEPYAIVGSGGAGWMKEDYTLEVVVTAFHAGDAPDVVFNRCVDLVNVVRSAVRGDPSLGGVVSTAFPSGASYATSWDEKGLGRFCVATIHIACSVQL